MSVVSGPQVYAVEERPLPYLVMEFVSGETLQQRLDRTGRLSVSEVVEIGRQIANGLAAAHAIGLIHRDVKPANVFLEEVTGEPGGVSPRTSDFTQNTGKQVRGLTPSGSPSMPSVKLLDFGLARAVDDVSITQSGMIVGTPLFMSPEQARSEPLNHRADLFSLGSVLYAMTTGQSAFRADNTLTTLKRVAEETPQPIDELAPETPRWLCNLIGKLLAKNPSERVQSASEVIALLARGESFNPNATGVGASTSSRTPMALRLNMTLALAAALVLGAFLLSFKTQNGEVIVEVPEDVPMEIKQQFKIEVRGDGGLRVADASNGWKIDAKEGQYDVQLTGGGDRVEINDKDKQVTVTRGQQAIVRIHFKPVDVVAADKPAPASKIGVASGQESETADPHRRAARWLRSLELPRRVDVRLSDVSERQVFPNDPLPAEPFRLKHLFLDQSEFDNAGDDLAELLAKPLRGVTIPNLHLNTQTLSTAGLAKLVRLPELHELEKVFLRSDVLDDGLFAEMATLPKLISLEVIACSKVTGKGVHALKACAKVIDYRVSTSNGIE